MASKKKVDPARERINRLMNDRRSSSGDTSVPSPREMQEAEAVLGGSRIDEITGGRGLSGAAPHEARRMVAEAARVRHLR